MRLINGISQIFAKPRRQDPIFGSMLYMGDDLKYWEGKAIFPPAGSEIEVFVDGSANDDMEHQHQFFTRLSQEWPAIAEAISGKLHGALVKRLPNVDINSIWTIFSVSSLSISNEPLETARWDISFTTSFDSSQLYTVEMEGRQPIGLAIDD